MVRPEAADDMLVGLLSAERGVRFSSTSAEAETGFPTTAAVRGGEIGSTWTPRREDHSRADEVGGTSTWNSLNFDEFANDVTIAQTRRWTPRRRRICFGYSGKTLARWAATVSTGITAGCVSIGLARASEALLLRRDAYVTNAPRTTGFAAFVAWGASLALISSSLVAFVAPGASGSGIPVVKAYLNGIRMEGCLGVRVFLVKFVGTALAVGSGATLGPEGPLVHLGAMSGSFFTGGLDPTRPIRALRSLVPRNPLKTASFRRRSVGGQPGSSAGASASLGHAATGPTTTQSERDIPPDTTTQAPDESPRGASTTLRRRHHSAPSLTQFASSDEGWLEAEAPEPPFFRTDVDRRDFLSIGAACGFAAAFGAPIGGVLFSLEEASSYWSNELMWRSLIGTAAAVFTALALEHDLVGLREISRFGLISLRSKGEEDVSLALVPMAVLAGVAGGVLGALFNVAWYRAMKARQRLARAVDAWATDKYAWDAFKDAWGTTGAVHRSRQLYADDDDEVVPSEVASRRRADASRRATRAKAVARVLDAVFGVAITSLVFYGVALASESWACVARDRDDDGWLADDSFVFRFTCDDGEVHELASLWFNTREKAIKKILEATNGELSAASLAVAGFLTLGTLILSFGSALPGGLFLPLIYCGACLGSAGARLPVIVSSPLRITRRHSALLGAVALLAGVQRSTVSLCVIILEGTGNTALLIPIIIVVCVARFVGNLFCDGLYELSIDLQKVPFLEKHVPSRLLERTVKHLLPSAGARAAAVLPRKPTLDQAAALLRDSRHGAYPVVEARDPPSSSSTTTKPASPAKPARPYSPRGPSPDLAADLAASSSSQREYARPEPRLKLLGLVLREHVKALLRAAATPREGLDDCVRPRLAQRLAMSSYDPGGSTTARSRRTSEVGTGPGLLLLDSGRASDVEAAGGGLEEPPRTSLRDFDALLASRAFFAAHPDETDRIDLTPAMVRSPYVVYDDCPVSRAYRLFVTMGARHLLVVNHDGDLAGILTRHDMLQAVGHHPSPHSALPPPASTTS